MSKALELVGLALIGGTIVSFVVWEIQNYVGQFFGDVQQGHSQ